jgi:hypothetical protein
MGKINLRISDARKKLADSEYRKQAIEIDRDFSHIKVNALTFFGMRSEDKDTYFRIYASWLKRKVKARLQIYLDAFKEENVIPDEADLSNMSWAFWGVIEKITTSLPNELKYPLEQLGREQVIEDARRDIEIFAQRMSIEQMRANARQQQPSMIHYNTHIYGDNRGNFQQGGSGNTQNINRNDDEVK